MAQQIDPSELAQRLAAGDLVLLLDVRQRWEHQLAALPGSVLIPLPELRSRVKEIEVSPGTLVVAYCHHGIRSMTAATLLEQLGIEQVASLEGGIDAWSIHIDPGVPRY